MCLRTVVRGGQFCLFILVVCYRGCETVTTCESARESATSLRCFPLSQLSNVISVTTQHPRPKTMLLATHQASLARRSNKQGNVTYACSSHPSASSPPPLPYCPACCWLSVPPQVIFPSSPHQQLTLPPSPIRRVDEKIGNRASAGSTITFHGHRDTYDLLTTRN